MHTHPVGQKTPTAWGLFDTNGNAVEWVQDWCRDPYPQGDATDPVGPTLGVNCRVLRGGSFLDSPLPFLSRGSFDPAHSMIHCGFRVCREL
jgi:formylglycine-generating enzyme required for sulfatase activity